MFWHHRTRPHRSSQGLIELGLIIAFDDDDDDDDGDDDEDGAHTITCTLRAPWAHNHRFTIVLLHMESKNKVP